MNFPVIFSGLPKNKNIYGELPKQLQFEVKSSGIKLFFLTLSKDKKPVNIDFKSLIKTGEGIYTFSPSAIGILGKNLGSNLEITRVKPEFILINFNKSTIKKIPVMADVIVDFQEQNNRSANIQVTPKYISVSGDSALLQQIDTIRTEKIILNDLDNSVSQTAQLIVPDDMIGKVFLSQSDVKVKFSIEALTENEIEIPVTILNSPPKSTIALFPKRVKIKYQVGLNDFQNVKKENFEAVVDFKNHDLNKSYIPIQLIQYPNSIKNFKLAPEKAEFIIEKK